MSLDIERIGAELAAVMHDAVAPLLKRLDALEARTLPVSVKGDKGDRGDTGVGVSDLLIDADGALVTMFTDGRTKALGLVVGSAGKDGRDGTNGKDGKDGTDAEPVEVLEVVAELLATDQLKSLVQSYVGVQTKAYFEANPIRHGQDGKDGQPGPQGDPGIGIKGDPGKDGAGVADLLIDRDGALVVTLTDGRTKSLGVVVGKDGKDGIGRDGKDGVDGLSFETAHGEFDAERGFVIRLIGSQKATEFVLPYMRHSGFWAEGKSAKAGESMTNDGALYIAKRNTKTKPCPENADDWIIAARKGRDGRDGRNGIDKTAVVKTIDWDPS